MISFFTILHVFSFWPNFQDTSPGWISNCLSHQLSLNSPLLIATSKFCGPFLAFLPPQIFFCVIDSLNILGQKRPFKGHLVHPALQMSRNIFNSIRFLSTPSSLTLIINYSFKIGFSLLLYLSEKYLIVFPCQLTLFSSLKRNPSTVLNHIYSDSFT